MKAEFNNSEETKVIDPIKGERTTSDESVASRGNVKETLKAYNAQVEEHYYDRKEIDYFFSKIWHWVKKHVIKSNFYENMAGDILGTHKAREDYSQISSKAMSVESIDSLVDALNSRVHDIEATIENMILTHTGQSEFVKLPLGFTYVQFPGTPSPEILFIKSIWKEVSVDYKGAFLRIDTNGKDLGNGVSPEFSNKIINIQNEKVPNLKGTLSTLPVSTDSSLFVDATGAFSKKEGLSTLEERAASFTDSGHLLKAAGLEFNANNFNSVFDGSHVIPQNIGLRIWVKIGNKVESDYGDYPIYPSANPSYEVESDYGDYPIYPSANPSYEVERELDESLVYPTEPSPSIPEELIYLTTPSTPKPETPKVDPAEELFLKQMSALDNDYSSRANLSVLKSSNPTSEIGVVLFPNETAFSKDNLKDNPTFKKWLKFYSDKGIIYVPKFNTPDNYMDTIRNQLTQVSYVFAINKACPPKMVTYDNLLVKYENDGAAKRCATDHYNTLGVDGTIKNGYKFGRAYFKKLSDFTWYLDMEMKEYKTFAKKRTIGATARPFDWVKIFGFWEEGTSEGICESLFGTCIDIDSNQNTIDNYVITPSNNGIFGYTGHASQSTLAMDNAGLEVSEMYSYSSSSKGFKYSDMRNANSRMILISNGCMVGEHYQSISGNNETFSLLGTSKLLAVFAPACYGSVIKNNFCYPFEETFLAQIKKGKTLGEASKEARKNGCGLYSDFFTSQMQLFGNPAFKAY